MPAPKPRYRQWPKRFDGDRNISLIDREKVKDQYLSGSHYSWPDFCKAFNYNLAADKRLFPIRAWQQEWIQQQVQTTEEGLMDEAIALKRQIAKNRLEFPTEWNRSAKTMKGLADFLLNREVVYANHDREHQKEILEGKRKPLSTLTPAFLGSLALAQARIQELQRSALLMPAANAYAAVLPIRDADPVDVEAESEEERLKSMEVHLVGGGTLNEETMMQIHSRWIDQQAGPSSDSPKPEEEQDRSPETDLLPATEVEV